MKTFKPLVIAGVVLGMGLGGFLDGILLHQIFQAHNMFSNRRFPDTLANVEINMFWDGLFHAAMWLTTSVGIVLMWRALNRNDVVRSKRAFLGAMILGWGAFNLVEGIIDHQILKLHHVIQRAPEPARTYWDLAFLALGGVLLILVGRAMINREKRKFRSQTAVNRVDRIAA